MSQHYFSTNISQDKIDSKNFMAEDRNVSWPDLILGSILIIIFLSGIFSYFISQGNNPEPVGSIASEEIYRSEVEAHRSISLYSYSKDPVENFVIFTALVKEADKRDITLDKEAVKKGILQSPLFEGKAGKEFEEEFDKYVRLFASKDILVNKWIQHIRANTCYLQMQKEAYQNKDNLSEIITLNVYDYQSDKLNLPTWDEYKQYVLANKPDKLQEYSNLIQYYSIKLSISEKDYIQAYNAHKNDFAVPSSLTFYVVKQSTKDNIAEICQLLKNKDYFGVIDKGASYISDENIAKEDPKFYSLLKLIALRTNVDYVSLNKEITLVIVNKEASRIPTYLELRNNSKEFDNLVKRIYADKLAANEEIYQESKKLGSILTGTDIKVIGKDIGDSNKGLFVKDGEFYVYKNLNSKIPNKYIDPELLGNCHQEKISSHISSIDIQAFSETFVSKQNFVIKVNTAEESLLTVYITNEDIAEIKKHPNKKFLFYNKQGYMVLACLSSLENEYDETKVKASVLADLKQRYNFVNHKMQK